MNPEDKALEMAKLIVRRLTLDGAEINPDDYDPENLPGVKIELGRFLLVVNYDPEKESGLHPWGWMVAPTVVSYPSGPPEPAGEVADGIALDYTEALTDGIAALMRWNVRYTIDEEIIMRPSLR